MPHSRVRQGGRIKQLLGEGTLARHGVVDRIYRIQARREQQPVAQVERRPTLGIAAAWIRCAVYPAMAELVLAIEVRIIEIGEAGHAAVPPRDHSRPELARDRDRRANRW